GGVLAVAEAATRAQIDRLICPVDSAAEAALAGVEPVPARHLAEAVAYLRGETKLEWVGSNGHVPEVRLPDLADVRGHERARQALEDGVVAIARAAGAAVFPARFQVVGTMNLCACGARGDPGAECSCSPQRVASFRDKLSRALLDRFDLVITVPRPRAVELAAA